MLHHFHDLENSVKALFSRFFIFSRSYLVLYLSFIGSERRENAAFFHAKTDSNIGQITGTTLCP